MQYPARPRNDLRRLLAGRQDSVPLYDVWIDRMPAIEQLAGQGGKMSDPRFATTEERQMAALEAIAKQLERLNDKLDSVSGTGMSETEHIRVVDMSRPPY